MLQVGIGHIKAFLKGRLFEKLARQISGTAAGQVVTLASYPIITRIYTPTDFGEFATYSVLISFALVAANLRLDQAIVIPSTKKEWENIYCTSFFSAVGFSIVVWVVLMTVWGFELVDRPGQHIALAILISMHVVSYGIFQSLIMLLNKEGKNGSIGVAFLIQAISVIAMQAVLGTSYSNWISLVVGHVFGLIVTIGFLHIKSDISTRVYVGYSVKSDFGKYVKSYSNFPLKSAPQVLINLLSQASIVLLLGFYFDESVVGAFALAHKLMIVPIRLVGVAVRQVFMVDIASRVQDYGFVVKKTGKFAWVLAVCGLVPFGLFLLYGKEVVTLLLGPDWLMAGEIAEILSVWLFLAFVYPPVLAALTVMQKNGVLLAYESFHLIFRVSTLIITALLTDNVLHFITGISFSGFFCISLLLIYFFKYSQSAVYDNR